MQPQQRPNCKTDADHMLITVNELIVPIKIWVKPYHFNIAGSFINMRNKLTATIITKPQPYTRNQAVV